jgi:hypothetical protein
VSSPRVGGAESPGSWIPRGRLYGSELGAWWMSGGAYAFFPLVEADGVVRLFAGGRDERGRSRIGIVSIAWGDPPKVLDVTPAPVLDLGQPGCFDMDGVAYPCVLRSGPDVRLYYTGWRKLGADVPFTTDVGLAVSGDDGRSFARVSRAPLLPLTDSEPIGVGSSCVVPASDAAWTMYYTRLLSWDISQKPPKPFYNIWKAVSREGAAWQRLDVNVISHDRDEYALGAPSFHRWGDTAQLYFTARGHRYRIFVAHQQPDGSFRRLPAPLHIPPQDWDDDMQCYPHVIAVRGRRYLLYCGNGYGRSGVGYAEWAGGN